MSDLAFVDIGYDGYDGSHDYSVSYIEGSSQDYSVSYKEGSSQEGSSELTGHCKGECPLLRTRRREGAK